MPGILQLVVVGIVISVSVFLR